MRELRSQGLPLSDIAKRTGSTVAVVRRIVGKVDPEAERERRRQLDAIALRIDAEPLTFNEKAERWKAETGKCAVTFWRTVKRAKGEGQ